MALPNNLTDLFVPKNNLPIQPTTLKQLPYKITWDVVHDSTAPPKLQAQLGDLHQAAIHRPDRFLAERLRRLVQEYPNVAVLKNYLMMTYSLIGRQGHADAILEQTVQQHPRYLMGLVNKGHQLLRNDDIAGVEQLFGGPPTDLAKLYPERHTFHVSEVAHFTHLAYAYACDTRNPDVAENLLRMLRDLHYHTKDQLRTMKRHLDFARMKVNMDKMQQGFKEAISINGYFRAHDQQTTERPQFENPSMEWLYEYGVINTSKPLPADKRDAILALPRPALTRDLSKALLDIVYRHAYFSEQDWDEEHHNFASHALLLMTELRAAECLEAVLETLRQDFDFREFWWGDYLTDFYEPYFRRLLPEYANELKAFMLEPDVNTFSKELISSAYAQEALANPALKPAIQAWYSDILTHLLDHADDEHLLDTDLLGWLIGDIVDLQLTDLLPLIRTAYERDLVTINIQGDLTKVEQEMAQRTYPTEQRPIRPLAEQYEYLRDPQAYHQAHPNPIRENINDDFLSQLEAQEDEWAFLYEDDEEEFEEDDLPGGRLFSSPQHRAVSSPTKPIVNQPRPGRNDKVSVRYPDGTVVRDVKYKKVEADIDAGKCILL